MRQFGTVEISKKVPNGRSDNRSNLFRQKQLFLIFQKFIQLHERGHKYIRLDAEIDGIIFSDSEIELIKSRSDFFYLCTPKRALLCIWIIDEIKKIFQRKGFPAEIGFTEIYFCLRKALSIESVNRSNLRQLLKCRDNVRNEDVLAVQWNLKYTLASIGSSNEVARDKNRQSDATEQLSENIVRYVFQKVGISNTENIENLRFTDDEIAFLDRMDEAINITDVEWCRHCFQFPEKIAPVLNALQVFTEQVASKALRKENLLNAINNICPSNYPARVSSLVKAYTSKAQFQEVLLDVFGQFRYVSDLDRIALQKNIDEDSSYMLILDFLKWLQNDLQQSARDGMRMIYKKERQRGVVTRRSQGYSLEEVGQHYGLTRERIRQIEASAERNFQSFHNRLKPQHILLAFADSEYCFGKSDIEKVFGDQSENFLYLLKKAGMKKTIWSEILEVFIVGERNWYPKVLKEIEALPAQFRVNELPDLISDICERLGFSIDSDVLNRIIMSQYRQIGSICSKSRMSKKNMYKFVFERYYPSGMKLFDDYEMMRFKKRLREEFGDMISGMSDTRAISAAITHFTILCDRGKYILPAAVQIQPELLEEIHSFILNHERSTLMFSEIFERYKAQLLEMSNINNRYFLQGVLKHNWSDQFEFSRDAISRSSAKDRSIKSHIELFVKNQHSVTIKDIKEEFFGITNVVVTMALAENSNILHWGVGKYIHASMVNVDEQSALRLKQVLDEKLIEGVVSARELFDCLCDSNPEIINDNGINNHIALFSLYHYLFPDEYTFKLPFISDCDIEGVTTTETVIEQHISKFDELTITELKAYLDEKHIKVLNITALIDENCPGFLRVDEEMLLRIENLSITVESIYAVESIVLAAIGDKGYIAAKDFEGYFFFPAIGTKWTPYLLVSFIKKYCKQVAISQYNVDYRYLNEIIIDKRLNIEKHDDLIRYALQRENSRSPFTSLNDVEVFLRSEGLIASTIPQSFFEHGIIVMSENGRITMHFSNAKNSVQ